jgi:Flp pilus assembly protein TadD
MRRKLAIRSAGTAAGWLNLLAALALTAGSGCQTVSTQPARLGPGQNGTNAANKPAAPAAQHAHGNDFHSDVGPEQQFNVHMELARAQEAMGNHEAAVTEYQAATDVCLKHGSVFGRSKLGQGHEALAQRKMAAALDKLGRFAQAETHYLNAMKLSPNDAKVWNDVGYSYYLQGHLDDAERALKTADSLDPNNPKVQTNLGLTLAMQGKNEQALAALARASGPAIAQANLGYVQAALKKPEEARKSYEKALAYQPELALARQALARLDASQAREDASVAQAGMPVLPLPSAAVSASLSDSRMAGQPQTVQVGRPATQTVPAPRDRQVVATSDDKPPGDVPGSPPTVVYSTAPRVPGREQANPRVTDTGH